MFCLKVLRFNRFSKLVLNQTNLSSINGKQLCRSLNMRSTISQITNSSENVNQNPDLNQFRLDLNVRREVLQQVFVISQNISKGGRHLNQLIEDKDFERICKAIEDNVTFLSNRQLINCLYSLLTIGVDHNSSLIRSLENQLLWKCKELSLKDILYCLSYHVRYQTTDLQKKAVVEMLINLVLKLDSAEDEEDIIHMLSLWQSLSPEIITKMEAIALDMICQNDSDRFGAKSLSYILVLMSQMNRRTKPLIKAVINKFTYSSVDVKDVNESHLIQMISAVNKLNFTDINFLRKASDILCLKRFLYTVSPSDRRDLLVAISQMNWSYPRLLDQYIEKIADNSNDFNSQDYLVLVSSFARLYCQSSYLNNILTTYVIPFVKLEDFDCDSRLLYVWSLSILGCVPLEAIKHVLSEHFYNQLMAQTNQSSIESPNYKQIVSKLKLLNIKAMAEIEMQQKIDFNPVSGKDYPTIKKELSVEKFKQTFQQSLHSFVSNVSTNVLTPFGFTIDAEFIINRDMDSLPLSEFGSSATSQYENHYEMPSLPEGFKRYAVLCFGFKDTLLDESGLLGIHELSIRLLKQLGYSVVAVNEKQLPTYLKSNQRSERIKSLLTQTFR